MVLGVGVLGGALAFLALLAALGLVSSVIEPGSRIMAFIAAAPQHRHPMQLATAAWSLYLLGGVVTGLLVSSTARSRRISPWPLLIAFAVGYLAVFVWAIPAPGVLSRAALAPAGYAIALFAAAVLCVRWRAVAGAR